MFLSSRLGWRCSYVYLRVAVDICLRGVAVCCLFVSQQEQEQEVEQEKEEERVPEIEEEAAPLKYSRQDRESNPWLLRTLASPPNQSTQGFYPCSEFSVMQKLMSPCNTLPFPSFMLMSENYYRPSWSLNTHRRLKNVIIVMEWIPDWGVHTPEECRRRTATTATTRDHTALSRPSSSACLQESQKTNQENSSSSFPSPFSFSRLACTSGADAKEREQLEESEMKRRQRIAEVFDCFDIDKKGWIEERQLCDFLRSYFLHLGTPEEEQVFTYLVARSIRQRRRELLRSHPHEISPSLQTPPSDSSSPVQHHHRTSNISSLSQRSSSPLASSSLLSRAAHRLSSAFSSSPPQHTLPLPSSSSPSRSSSCTSSSRDIVSLDLLRSENSRMNRTPQAIQAGYTPPPLPHPSYTLASRSLSSSSSLHAQERMRKEKDLSKTLPVPPPSNDLDVLDQFFLQPKDESHKTEEANAQASRILFEPDPFSLFSSSSSPPPGDEGSHPPEQLLALPCGSASTASNSSNTNSFTRPPSFHPQSLEEKTSPGITAKFLVGPQGGVLDLSISESDSASLPCNQRRRVALLHQVQSHANSFSFL